MAVIDFDEKSMPQLKNTAKQYGLVSKVLHSLVAVVVLGLFGLGFWMVELDYYDSWYRTAPDLHKSIGVLIAFVIIARLIWNFSHTKVEPLATHKPIEIKLAKLAHYLLYLLLLILVISGYLISTADGRGIEIFSLFELPALGSLFENQEDLAGAVHKWIAYGLVSLVVIHVLGALKHHVIDKDSTLKRMF